MRNQLLILGIWTAMAVHNVQGRPVEGDSNVVGDLLASLFRQTIYNRMENLLLDPGKMSDEKGKIVESAVQNYHRQVYQPPTKDGPVLAEISEDISNFAGMTTDYLLAKVKYLVESDDAIWVLK